MATTSIGSTTSIGRGECPQLTISVHRAEDRAVIALAGEMDIAVEKQVHDLVSAAIADPGLTALHIDVAAVTFFGSSGLSSMLLAREAAIDHGLAFTLGVGDAVPVARLVALFGMESMFDLWPDQAVAAAV